MAKKLVLESGLAVREAARVVGIHHTTILAWARNEGWTPNAKKTALAMREIIGNAVKAEKVIEKKARRAADLDEILGDSGSLHADVIRKRPLAEACEAIFRFALEELACRNTPASWTAAGQLAATGMKIQTAATSADNQEDIRKEIDQRLIALGKRQRPKLSPHDEGEIPEISKEDAN